MRIAADGVQRAIGALDNIDGQLFIPNGFAVEQDGSLLIANMGEAGGVWRLRPDGTAVPVLTEIEGVPLGATNFVMIDDRARIFVTVTTRQWPIGKAFYSHETGGRPDGMIIVIDDSGPRVIADDLCFANELRLDSSGTSLYVAETFAGRILRYSIDETARLGQKETAIEFGPQIFPDGIAFDSEGYLWTASIISNRILRVSPSGSVTIILQEDVPGHAGRIADRISSRTLAREDVTESPATVLKNPSSIAFGGADLKTVHVGSLGGDSIITFRSPVAGLPLSHWHQS